MLTDSDRAAYEQHLLADVWLGRLKAIIGIQLSALLVIFLFYDLPIVLGHLFQATDVSVARAMLIRSVTLLSPALSLTELSSDKPGESSASRGARA